MQNYLLKWDVQALTEVPKELLQDALRDKRTGGAMGSVVWTVHVGSGVDQGWR